MKNSTKPYTEELLLRIHKKRMGITVKPSAKSETLFNMKPKIPKSGNSRYRGFYIRPLENTEFIYHIDSELFVARMNKSINPPMEARKFIDERYDDIMERIQKCCGLTKS